jgi:hypothetical protein
MFRLTAFATALLLALHATPPVDAVVVANTCTPTLATFVDDAAFFSTGEGNFGSANDKPGECVRQRLAAFIGGAFTQVRT